jgi:hypothetical protein
MAKLSVNPSKLEVVKKTLSVAAPTGGTMGGVASAANKNSMDSSKPLSEVAIVTEQLNFAPKRVAIKGLGEVPVEFISTLTQRNPSLGKLFRAPEKVGGEGYYGDEAEVLKGLLKRAGVSAYSMGSKTADKQGVRNYIAEGIKKIKSFRM